MVTDVEEQEVKVRADRGKILQELTALEEQCGVLKPDAVVEFAKDESTELHKEFNWDNTEAAHQWRLFQARQLIRAVVTIVRNEGNEIVTNAFVHFGNDGQSERGYVSIAKVLTDEELRTRMLRTAKRELETFRRKYADLKELTKVFDAIDSLI